jgi:branched-chain amino acid transport system ATP-binding protein
MLLELKNIHTSYDHVKVLRDISMDIEQGGVVTIIGANGAGKSTLLKTISGLVNTTKGEIKFQGKDITRMPAHQRVKEGIIQVPEGRLIFAPLSVQENLELGMYPSFKEKISKKEIASRFDYVFELFPRLNERITQRGETLSGGEQQMLAIGRAIMGKPKILLLDEPSLGLAPILVDTIFKTLRKLRDEGLTILLVEQNAQVALEFAEYGYLMEIGKIALEDTTDNLKANDKVREVYLGTE